jgi:lysine/ornithine N-monooxygenase
MELDLAASTLIVEQDTDVPWQRVMLLPWAQSQVSSYLKDLVTGSTASSTSCASREQQRTALL